LDKAAFKKKFGQHISTLRKKKNLTQSQLARLCGKDAQSIHKLENGNFAPTIIYLYEIAKALDVPLWKLCDFEM
jgi:transcriptional regulator with XRE-family HTH domain